jgi:hypothetical protein
LEICSELAVPEIHIDRVDVLLPKRKSPVRFAVQGIPEISGGLPLVITVWGCPINKILEPDGLRSFLFAVPCKMHLRVHQIKNPYSAHPEQGFY